MIRIYNLFLSHSGSGAGSSGDGGGGGVGCDSQRVLPVDSEQVRV